MTPTVPSPFMRVAARTSGFRTVMRAAAAAERVSSLDALEQARIVVSPLAIGGHDQFGDIEDVAELFGLHVAPEVALTAIFQIQSAHPRGDAADAMRALRGKRVDFLLFDGAATPVLAIDVRGEDDWRGRALRRDRVKRLAFEKAGLPLLEIGGPACWPQDRAMIEGMLSRATAA